jgi:hypothetical protein
MRVTRARARACGAAAIAAVALLQGFNSAACYRHNLDTYLETLLFIAIPMLPAFVSLATRNPLRAVGASLLFAPWLVVAYFVDCVTPYRGGGASMIYVAVVLFGFPSALAGALVTGPILRRLNVSLDELKGDSR